MTVDPPQPETWEWGTRTRLSVNVVKRGSEALARKAVASCDESLDLCRRRPGGTWHLVPAEPAREHP